MCHPWATTRDGRNKNAFQFSKSGGDIEMVVTATVSRPGTYWIHAELWAGTSGNIPVAFAVDRIVNVEDGLLRRSMIFGGAIIRDRGLGGPFTVRNVRLNQVDTMPPQESTPVAELPPTPAWKVIDFY